MSIHHKATASILAVFLAACFTIGHARAANTTRFDRFTSRRSGNVVRVPTRCWQEDSLAHLYMAGYNGATLTLHCHHKGY